MQNSDAQPLTPQSLSTELNILANSGYFEVEVNGFPVFEQWNVEERQVTIAVDYLLKPGENTVEVYSYADDETPNAKISIDVLLAHSKLSNNIKLFNMIVADNYSADSAPGVGSYELSKNNDMDSSYSIISLETNDLPYDDPGVLAAIKFSLPNTQNYNWQFLSSEDILAESVESLSDEAYEQASDEFLKSLFPYYKELHAAFASKNIDKIVAVSEQRSQEMDVAFKRQAGDTSKDFREELAEIIEDPDFALVPIEMDALQVKFFNNNKLIKLQREDGSSAIAFNGVDGGGSYQFDFVFLKHADKWIIAR